MSKLEWTLHLFLKDEGLPAPDREVRFHPTRRWRFDFAWPDLKIAAECEGGTFTGGRHVRGAGFQGDCEKYNAAAIRGWTVLRFTREMIMRGQAVEEIKTAIEKKTAEAPRED